MSGKLVLKRMSALLFALILCVAMMGATTMPAKADTGPISGSAEGFSFEYWIGDDGKPTSFHITGYTGSETTVILPTHGELNGVEYELYPGVDPEAFKGNTTIQKVVIPATYEGISEKAFAGCTSLTTIIVSNISAMYIAPDAFNGCPGVPVSDAAQANVKRTIKLDGSDGTTPVPTTAPVDKTKLKGKDGTFYGEGASKEAVNKALTTLKGEKDQKGMVFNKLRLKAKKVAKTSITLGWSKPSGTVQFVLYGNKCGKTNKYVKIKELKKTSFAVKKVNGKAVKKGTYYKFVIVALDKSGKVVSTSKTIHVATNGGKFTNFKSVTTKAKKSGKFKAVSKLSVKKGKKVPLKTKAVKLSKKMKAQTHVAIRYESTNTKVATVTAKGVIKGVKKGKCKVYAYAQNGVFKAVTVTVK